MKTTRVCVECGQINEHRRLEQCSRCFALEATAAPEKADFEQCTLEFLLKDWTETDFALRAVATSLGIRPPLEIGPHGRHWGKDKGLFWSRHSLNVWAFKILRDLCEAGVVEYREEPEEQYRWVGHFPTDGDENAFGQS